MAGEVAAYRKLRRVILELIADGCNPDEIRVSAAEISADYVKYGENMAMIAQEDLVNDI